MNADEFISKIKSFNIIKIQTLYPEKILNMLQIENIPVLEVRYDEGCLFFKSVNRDLAKIDEILRRFGTTYECVKILGAEKAAQSIKKRFVFICVAAVFILTSFIFSRCVWRIDIFAAEEIYESEIREFLYENGIKQSVPKREVDCEKIEILLTKQFEHLGEPDVDLSGTKLVITFTQIDSPVVMFDKSIPVDLVASESGVISHLDVYNGVAVVKEGDYVNEGDVLISGSVGYTFRDEPGISHVHAMGKILMYKNIEVCDIIINKYAPNSDADFSSEKKFYIFGKTVTFGSGEEHDDSMYIEETNKPLRIAWFQLPVLYDEIKWYDINNCRIKSDEEIALEINAEVKRLLSGKCSVLDITYNLNEGKNGELNVICRVKCAYNMAVERKIE